MTNSQANILQKEYESINSNYWTQITWPTEVNKSVHIDYGYVFSNGRHEKKIGQISIDVDGRVIKHYYL